MIPRRIYAHRGANVEWPENTMAAFARAVAVGVNALETDAHLTRDGHVILAHDPHGERTAGVPMPWAKATLAEVQTLNVHRMADGRTPPGVFRVPTLAEALAAFPEVHFNVDLKAKTPALVEATLAVVAAAQATERTTLTSFSYRTVRRITEAGYAGERGLSQWEALGVLYLPEQTLAKWFVGQRRAAQFPTRALGRVLDSQAFISKLHTAGLRADFWTINDPAHAVELLARGADGIMTDDPAAIMAAVNARPSTSLAAQRG